MVRPEINQCTADTKTHDAVRISGITVSRAVADVADAASIKKSIALNNVGKQDRSEVSPQLDLAISDTLSLIHI